MTDGLYLQTALNLLDALINKPYALSLLSHRYNVQNPDFPLKLFQFQDIRAQTL